MRCFLTSSRRHDLLTQASLAVLAVLDGLLAFSPNRVPQSISCRQDFTGLCLLLNTHMNNVAVDVLQCYLLEMVSSSGSPGVTALISRPRNCPRPSFREDTQDITSHFQNELGWGLLESKAGKEHSLPFQGLCGIVMTLTHSLSLSFSLSLLRQPALLWSGDRENVLRGRVTFFLEFTTEKQLIVKLCKSL